MQPEAQARPRHVRRARRRQHDRLRRLPAAVQPRAARLELGLWLAGDDRRHASASPSCCRGSPATSPAEAAPFTFPAAAFGPGAGFVVAWSYWISIWVDQCGARASRSSAICRSSGRARSPRPRRAGDRHRLDLAAHPRQLPGRARGRRRPGRHHPAQAAAAGRRDRSSPSGCSASGSASLPAHDAVPISARRDQRRGDPHAVRRCSASRARWRRATGSRIRGATSRAPRCSAPRSPASSIFSPAPR